MMIDKYKKIVVKIGSSSIIDSKTKKINTNWLKKLCKDIEKYHKDKKIIIVCSAACFNDIAIRQDYCKT